MIGKFLLAWVETIPELVDLIGKRIHPNTSQDDYPYLTYSTITDQDGTSLSGPDGLRRETLQIDIADTSYPRAIEIEEAIVGKRGARKLNGYSVTLGDDVLVGITVREARLLDRRDRYEVDANGRQSGVQGRQLDFLFVYENVS